MNSNILARLEELRKWQIKQQERLQISRKTPEIHQEVQINESNSIKETPILTKTQRNVQKLHEFENKNDFNESVSNASVIVRVEDPKRPKREFLKRGSGLVRFKMTQEDCMKPYGKKIAIRKIKKGIKNDEIKNDEGLELKSNFKGDFEGLKLNRNFNDDLNCLDDLKKVASPLKLPNFEIKLNDEVKTLTIDEESLIKQTILNINEIAGVKIINSNQNVTNSNQNNQCDDIEIVNKGNCNKEINEKCEINEKSLNNNQNELEINEETLLSERELLIFEALEEKLLNSSFSSTNSSILKILSSTPNKLKSLKIERDRRIDNQENDENNKNNENTNRIIEESSFCSSLDSEITEKSENNSDCCEEDREEDDFISNSTSNFNSASSSASNSVLNSASNSISNQTSDESTLQDAATINEITISGEGNQVDVDKIKIKNDEVLTGKLKILDEEIEKFRLENSKLQKKRLELDKEWDKLGKEKRAFEKYVLEEKVKVEFYLEEEKRAFAKEKLAFERYVKDIQSRTNRKERDEIVRLKDELATVREAAKLKDRRNATSQARLRNQLKTYEKDIDRLKDEAETLRKQNAKLINEQRIGNTLRKKNESKVLQEINKNLSKLTKDNKDNRGNDVDKGKDKDEEKNKIVEEENNNRKNNDFDRIIIESPEDLDRKAKELVDENLVKTYEEVFGCENQLNLSNKSKNSSGNDLRSDSRNNLRNDSRNNSRNNSGNDSRNDLKNDSRNDSRNDSGNDLRNDSRNDSGNDSRNDSRNDLRNDSRNGKRNDSKNLSQNDTLKLTKTETIYENGTKETKYSNGNLKITSPDGNLITMNYFNGDKKVVNNLNGTVKYFYAENETSHTSFPDGTEIIEFKNGQIETKRSDGTYEIKLPDGIIKITRPDKSEDLSYPDGTRVSISREGDKEIILPNGQKEIHTKDHMRRVYLDGTVKILYPDGIQETRYSNGRIRIKDKNGKLLLDSHEENT